MSLDLSVNPLRVGLPREKVVDPCNIVIFGGTGDLAQRKLLPALYYLFIGGHLPSELKVYGYASAEWTDDDYRAWAKDAISRSVKHLPTSGPKWDEFESFLRYIRRHDDTIPSLADMKGVLESAGLEHSCGNCLFYLAVPPQTFAEYAQGLREVGLARDPSGACWRRIVVEKPFGTDLASGRDLNRALQSAFGEDQIYRIDHYLGKETVQNIQVFRFANEFAEPLLNWQYVDHIQLTVAESIGIEGRGGYYDANGALRDMVQNHLLQVISLVCMEPPTSLDAESIRDEKLRLLRSIRRISPADVADWAVRGQYEAGVVAGRDVPGYRQEDHVAPDSMTETYVALKLTIDNDRWRRTPVYLRTGKRLARRVSEVAIQLKPPPGVITGQCPDTIQPNVIALRIQPDEGISIKFNAKVPGLSYRLRPVRMEFDYGSSFEASVPDAYERLLLDALLGDPSLYPRADALEAAWEIVQPIMDGWHAGKAPLYPYRPGSWGPAQAAAFIERDGRSWRRL